MANVRNLKYQGATVEQPKYKGTELTKWIHNGIVVWEKGKADTVFVSMENPMLASMTFHGTWIQSSSGYYKSYEHERTLNLWICSRGMIYQGGGGYRPGTSASQEIHKEREVYPDVAPWSTIVEQDPPEPDKISGVFGLSEVGQTIKVITTKFNFSRDTDTIWSFFISHGIIYLSDKPFKLYLDKQYWYYQKYNESVAIASKIGDYYYLCDAEFTWRYGSSGESYAYEKHEVKDVQYLYPTLENEEWLVDRTGNTPLIYHQLDNFVMNCPDINALYNRAKFIDLIDATVN